MDDLKEKEAEPSDAGKRKKLALGKGLGALITGASMMDTGKKKDYFLCPVDDIRPNRYQPRRDFPEEELADLSRSIREQGVIQPLVVRENGEGYELIAGERRLRAARMAGMTRVPVVIKELDTAGLLAMSLVENIQRADLNPVEESDAYHRLMNEFGLTQEQVAEQVGKSRSAVANFVRLRQLPDDIRATLRDGRISTGHAKVLLSADTPAQQRGLWRRIIEKALSVREAEILLNRMKAGKPGKEPLPENSDTLFFTSVAENLSRHFGTKVQILRSGKKGKVEIEFYTDEDLERLLKLLRRPEETV